MSEIRAAGGVLWRSPEDTGTEIAIIHRPRYDDWSLPKGKLEPGEDFVDAAVREVWEETGHRVVVGAALGAISYVKADRHGAYHNKVVHFWAMRAAGGRFAPGDEVDALEWIAPAQAEGRLSYGMDLEVVRRFAWVRAGA